MSSYRLQRSDSRILSAKQRLTLILDTGISPTAILAMDDAAIEASFLAKHMVPPRNITASGLTPLALKVRGLETAAGLVALGFDSLHLVNSIFCESAIAAYGAVEVVEAFVRSPTDAVALAGTGTARLLGITQDYLLGICAGASIEAIAVLTQAPRDRLHNVRISTLLDAGLRASQLFSIGVQRHALDALEGTAAERAKLEFY